MPQTCPDTADAVELAELLQFIARWLTADPAILAPSFLDYISHPAYGLDQSSPTKPPLGSGSV